MSKPIKPFKIPTIIDRSIIFEESLIKIQRDQLQIDDHKSYTYYSLHTHPTSVAILAFTPEGSLVITQEYRHPTGQILLGCPGGYIDPKEDALMAAKRELQEETGYQATSFSILGSAFPYAGVSSQKTIYVEAAGAILITPPKLEASEVIRPIILTLESLLTMIKEGAQIDGTLCTALFFIQNKKSI